MTNEITISPTGMSIDEILVSKRRMAELMKSVLKKNEHYGIIPGTKKNTLYKSGAEIVAIQFGIHPMFDVTMSDLENGHREYEVACTMYRNSDKMEVGSGVGMCTTMEKKYRYRNVKKYNPEINKQEETQIDNPSIADVYNTVLKMSKKRAFVDAILTSTAASDFFSQDLEDFEDVIIKQPWDDEIGAIDDIGELIKYYEANKGKGKEFDNAIIKRKTDIEGMIIKEADSTPKKEKKA